MWNDCNLYLMKAVTTNQENSKVGHGVTQVSGLRISHFDVFLYQTHLKFDDGELGFHPW